jgi:hypothetical protein
LRAKSEQTTAWKPLTKNAAAIDTSTAEDGSSSVFTYTAMAMSIVGFMAGAVVVSNLIVRTRSRRRQSMSLDGDTGAGGGTGGIAALLPSFFTYATSRAEVSQAVVAHAL